METINEKPIIVTQEMADRLLEVTDPSSLSREERLVYEEVVKQYRDYKNTIDYAEERGYQKGYAETLLSIAQNLKSQNFPVSFISKITELSPEEIEQL